MLAPALNRRPAVRSFQSLSASVWRQNWRLLKASGPLHAISIIGLCIDKGLWNTARMFPIIAKPSTVLKIPLNYCRSDFLEILPFQYVWISKAIWMSGVSDLTTSLFISPPSSRALSGLDTFYSEQSELPNCQLFRATQGSSIDFCPPPSIWRHTYVLTVGLLKFFIPISQQSISLGDRQ